MMPDECFGATRLCLLVRTCRRTVTLRTAYHTGARRDTPWRAFLFPELTPRMLRADHVPSLLRGSAGVQAASIGDGNGWVTARSGRLFPLPGRDTADHTPRIHAHRHAELAHPGV
jgi:hypothetical protein